MQWRRETTGWVIHRQGVAWHRMPLPGWWRRAFHRCVAHTTSVHSREVTQRCWCGAVRFGDTGLIATSWAPSVGVKGADVAGLKVKMGPWKERNTRYNGTALVYRPYVHALEES